MVLSATCIENPIFLVTRKRVLIIGDRIGPSLPCLAVAAFKKIAEMLAAPPVWGRSRVVPSKRKDAATRIAVERVAP